VQTRDGDDARERHALLFAQQPCAVKPLVSVSRWRYVRACVSPLLPVLLMHDSRFREHACNEPHPERPERLAAIDAALGALPGPFTELAARPTTDAELLRVHSPAYLAELARVEGRNARPRRVPGEYTVRTR